MLAISSSSPGALNSGRVTLQRAKPGVRLVVSGGDRIAPDGVSCSFGPASASWSTSPHSFTSVLADCWDVVLTCVKSSGSSPVSWQFSSDWSVSVVCVFFRII
jgi:hypothetical protein